MLEERLIVRVVGLHDMSETAVLDHLPGALGRRSIPAALLQQLISSVFDCSVYTAWWKVQIVGWECPTMAANLRLKASA